MCAELNAAVCFSQQCSGEMKKSVICCKTRPPLLKKKKHNYESIDLYLREMVQQLKKAIKGSQIRISEEGQSEQMNGTVYVLCNQSKR